jgi:hypothetical protein
MYSDADRVVQKAVRENPLLVNPVLKHVTPDVDADAVMEQEIEEFVRQGLMDGTYTSAEEARVALFVAMRDLLAQSKDREPALTERKEEP